MKNKAIKEKTYLNSEIQFLAGVDEAGRGPLAGPVVASAVLYDEKLISGLFADAKDSKLLSPARREAIYQKILKSTLCYGVGIVDNQRIDEINILNATFEAMSRAVLELESKLQQEADLLLVDGNKKIKNLDRRQIAIVKGDSLVKTISVASIIAKVTRDSLMLGYHEQWPEFGFAQHKGYGTKLHLEKIRRHGPSPIHRASFKPKALS